MNKVILMGNLTRDPEMRYSQGDNPLAIARFSLAINRRFARQGETDVDFFNCTAFGKTAEFIERYFKQGSRLVLSGRIQNDNYTNKNGEKVYSVQIIAEDVEFAERKSVADANTASHGGNPSGGDNGSTSTPQPSSSIGDDFMNIPDGIDESLPFN